MQDDEDEKELRDMFRILDKEKKGEVNTNELRYSMYIQTFTQQIAWLS